MKLSINSLSKTYANGVHALRNVSLILNNGMFGLLGPNGAGKSSLMRTIATLQEADTGSIFLDDLDVLKNKTGVRQLLGYLPQEFGVYPKVSAERMLDHIARLKGIANAGLCPRRRRANSETNWVVIGGFDRAISAITRIRLFGSFSAISVIWSAHEPASSRSVIPTATRIATRRKFSSSARRSMMGMAHNSPNLRGVLVW